MDQPVLKLGTPVAALSGNAGVAAKAEGRQGGNGIVLGAFQTCDARQLIEIRALEIGLRPVVADQVV